jgi:predicted dehydrogenase
VGVKETPMARRQYGLAVIGTGCIWGMNNGHWQALKQLADEIQVRYVYDINRAAMMKAADETGAKAVETADEIFAAPDVDIVTIATPPDQRLGYVQQTAAAGKHLMLEKPMARTIEQALGIVQAIRSARVKCLIPFARTGSARMRRVVDIVRSGELGDPIGFIHHKVGGPYAWVPLDHWMHDQTRSGGPIFDYSIHFLELCRACMGREAQKVLYGGAITSKRVKSDDQTMMMVYFNEDVCGEFTMSWNFPPNVELWQENGYMICRDGVITFRPELKIHVGKEIRDVEVPENTSEGRTSQYQNLIAAIEDDAPLHADELTGLRITEILDAALRSRESGCKELVHLHTV